jgi:DnaJ-class molecular chaperone
VSIIATSPRAGKADEIGREDDRSGHDGSGYERDETDQFHQLVCGLVVDGDDRARTAGRRARRTIVEMAPGYDRQPVLRMTTAEITFTASQACQRCGGSGGQTVDTSGDGVSRQHWQTCQACGGSGVAR